MTSPDKSLPTPDGREKTGAQSEQRTIEKIAAEIIKNLAGLIPGEPVVYLISSSGLLHLYKMESGEVCLTGHEDSELWQARAQKIKELVKEKTGVEINIEN